MRFIIFTIFFLLIYSYANGQNIDINYYSESENNGLIIQNSFPKGGPYQGFTKKNFNYSYLVFYTRMINTTNDPIE